MERENNYRFAVFRSYKSLFQPEKNWNDISITKFRVALTKLRFGINELIANKRYGNSNNTRPFCSHKENEAHLLNHCPTYNAKHIFISNVKTIARALLNFSHKRKMSL